VGVAGEVCACAAPVRGAAGRLSRVATVYLVRSAHDLVLGCSWRHGAGRLLVWLSSAAGVEESVRGGAGASVLHASGCH